MFTKKESAALLISVIVLSFVFGFDDGKEIFSLNNWIFNFFIVLIAVFISLLFRELIFKWFARRHDATSEYEIWNINQVWFNKKLERGFPLGIFIAVVLAIASTGKFFFTALGVHRLREIKHARVGRKSIFLEYSEEAKIASMGILSHLFLASLGLLAGNFLGVNMSAFVNINFFMALFNLLPISNLDGAKIFFGSLITYIFVVVFTVVAFLLININLVLGWLIALIAGLIIVFIYYFFFGR